MPNVFLVHAASDLGMAGFLKAEIESRAETARVFVASRPGQIPSGADWLAEIQSNLKLADLFLVLLTEKSLKRYWVWYESGAAWMSGKRVIPLAAPGLRRELIPYPLAARQTLALDDPSEVEQLFIDLGTVHSEASTFVATMERLAAAAREVAAEEEGWQGATLAGRYFAWRGPLHSLDDRAAVQAPPGLEEALRVVGCTPYYGSPERLPHHLQKGRMPVFETDRTSWKRAVLRSAGDRLVLLIRPQVPPDSTSG